MELRHLRYFVAVAEELHFGRAAERVLVAQPALSYQIKQLERELGVELLSRTRRRVELTASGQALLEEARRTLGHAERAAAAARQAARGELGRLDIGASGPAIAGMIPQVIRAFRCRAPQVELALRPLRPTVQVDALLSHELDVGFLGLGDAVEGLEAERLASEPILIALPASHRLGRRKVIDPRTLAHESFVWCPRSSCGSFHDAALRVCERAGFAPRVVQESTYAHTVVAMVAAGLGVSLVPGSVQEFRRSGVVYRRLTDLDAVAESAVAWRRGNNGPVLRLFLRVVREVAQATVPQDPS
jgi:DNA-binding transcriptional LysR family regulator